MDANDTRKELRDTDQKLDHLINKVGDLSVSVGSLDTKQCLMHEDIKENGKEVKKQNSRLRKLENWRSYLAGGLAVLTAVVLILVKVFLT